VRKISKKELLIKGTNIFHNKFDRTTVSMWVIIILQKLYFRVLSKSQDHYNFDKSIVIPNNFFLS
jgi:hypothetical protein